jgi:hypothetical protein
VPAHEGADGRLLDLHDEYVWEVNAAIAEGREDLIQRLVDDHLDKAMQMMSEVYGGSCGRSDCAFCSGLTGPQSLPRRTRWWRRLRHR